MTNYTELKRLAEASKLELADIANVVIEDGDLSHHELFQSLASPDVVLGLIKSLEHTTMAAEAEAKEVDECNAVIDRLRTQNQALVEALERMVESVTGVDQVSAVNAARAALTAAKQAQPEREMQKLFLTAGLFPDACKFDADGSPSFYTKESADKFAAGKLDVPCKGKNCGSLNGWLHSAECRAEHEAACSEQAQPEPYGYHSPKTGKVYASAEAASMAMAGEVKTVYLAQPERAPLSDRFLQPNDYHLLHRFIETTEDDEGYDITKAEIKRLADLGVVQLHGFGKYSVTMFGYWVHEHYWEQNPSLPLKTNSDRNAEAAIKQGGQHA